MKMWQDIARFGRKVVTSGLSHSHFGNISIRVADKILITRSGSMLDEIGADQVVEVGLFEESSLDILASSETVVHRAIYRSTSALAIIHTHSPYAVALSIVENNELEPVDSEGAYFLHKIPIVEGGIGTGELGNNAAEALREHKACIARGHGVFVVGSTLEEAFVTASMVEHSLQIKYLVEVWEKAR
jgi:L-fuculose-phosphate aldolase